MQEKDLQMYSKQNEIIVLGAYGTKLKGYGTTSFYLDKKNAIDAGNLLEALGDKSVEIENIWLTHSHLDHICDIAYIIDNYFVQRKNSLNIIGLKQTIKAVKEHFLNNHIWPDFSKIKMHHSEEMTVKYIQLELGVEYKLNKNSSIEAFETDHTVESCGYIYKKNDNSVLITADTYSLDNVIDILESRKDIGTMVLECSFPSSMSILAKESKHLTPKILFKKLEELKRKNIKLFINHIKPIYLEKITSELNEYSGKKSFHVLKDGEIINF